MLHRQLVCGTLLLLVACLACAAVATVAPAVPSTPPPLPYKQFATWAVISQNFQKGNGASKEEWSFGMHLSVSLDEELICIWEAQELFPTTPNYLITTLANYTSGVETSHFARGNGTYTNCTSKTLQGTIQPTGGWLFGPDSSVMTDFAFLEYTAIGDYNCSVWQRMEELSFGYRIFTWTVQVGTGIPMVYVNLTKNNIANNTVVLTTAYNGYHQSENGLPMECFSTTMCGAEFCVADTAASSSVIQGAIQWVCGQEDCSPINEGGALHYPNTDIAHGTWAFNKYFQRNKGQGAAGCAFGGAGELVTCSTACTMCNASTTASPAALEAALKWVCSKDGIQDCSPIKPNGTHFFPNTTIAHADWAFNTYYQAYKCLPDWNSCDFGGAAVIVPCQ